MRTSIYNYLLIYIQGLHEISPLAKRILPNIETLSRHLKALSLAGNRFTRLPDSLVKLSALEVLDFSGNKELQILSPLTAMVSAMPAVRIIDFRGVHKEKQTSYWYVRNDVHLFLSHTIVSLKFF